MSYFQNNENRIVDDLVKLIAIPSVSIDTKQVERALDCVLDIAKAMGMKTKKLLNGRVGVIEIGEGEETLGILAHVDVVGPGNLKAWNTSPYGAPVKNGKITGRGALDDKGPIIAVLHAMNAALENGQVFKRKVSLIIGTQEEVEWTDMRDFVEQYPLPDFGFTPDGVFPIANVEKGYMDVLFKFPFNKVQNYKNKDITVEKIWGGEASNVLPEKCRALLSDGRIISGEGKACHTCQPEKGENAFFIILKKIEEEERQLRKKGIILAETAPLKALRFAEKYFKDIYGRNTGLYASDDYYQGEYVHKTVYSPVMLTTNDSQVDLTVNIRFAYGTNVEKMKNRLLMLAEENGGTADFVDIMQAVFVSKHEPFIKELASAYEEVTGKKNEFVLATGTSYAKAMPRIVSWGPILPEMEDTCHEANEYILVKDLITNGKIYYSAICKIAQ